METHYLKVRLGLSLCFAGLLPGCQLQHEQASLASEQVIAKRPSVTAADYLRQEKKAEPGDQVSLLLEAANASLADGNSNQASRLAQDLSNRGLMGEAAERLQLLHAALNLADEQPQRAQSILLKMGEINAYDLNRQRIQLLIQAYQMLGQKLKSIKLQAHLLSQMSNTDETNSERMELWEQLSRQPLPQLKQWLGEVQNSSEVAGWLRLAMIMREEDVASSEWLHALAQWREAFPKHPASVLIPPLVSASAETKAPKRIALMLPLTGPYAAQGESVRRGFYAAYFQQREKQGDQAPVLQVYDTNETPMDMLLQRAKEQQATEIVGPLLKKNLEALLENSPLGIPVLALNSIDKTVPGVIQFSFSPEALIDQLAEKVAAAKRWRVAILVPNTASGERLLDRFRADWSYYRGDVVGVFRYDKVSGYDAGIQHLLNRDQAKVREDELQRLLGKKLRIMANTRQDIDAFVLIGERSVAQSLRPLLSFYFAGNLPVYTTSQLIDNPSEQSGLTDLNGVQFLATPWQAMSTETIPLKIGKIRAQLQQAWPDAARKNGVFYAMGVDAYFLLERLSMLQSMPHFSYFGETGVLTIDPNQRIYPRLLWLKLIGGKPELLNHG